jgi:DNA-binding NarL/FixJ family response regulator
LGILQSLDALRTGAAVEPLAYRRINAKAIDRIVSSVLTKRRLPSELGLREWQVVEAGGKGWRSPNLAAPLGITERTFKSHLTNIFRRHV